MTNTQPTPPPQPLLQTPATTWKSACSQQTDATLEEFLRVTNLLLERVQLNSTHLFRADILFDSTTELSTVQEKEASCDSLEVSGDRRETPNRDSPWLGLYEPPTFEDFAHRRTVIRRLIPRKPQLDKPLEQSCYTYDSNTTVTKADSGREVLVVYQPHCDREEEMPWYHPKVKSLAYHFSTSRDRPATLTVHYLPFSNASEAYPSDRLERTFLSLLRTMVRLLKHPATRSAPVEAESHDIATMPLTPSTLKDTILPQHIVQNTYTRLKQTYASQLISKWIEKTEPSKHVFEDLSIAAFLIELWNNMYSKDKFPGFVDIACGNGVLVYILIKEGYPGHGFDARKRKTWEVLDIEEQLHEQICIPQPFLDVFSDTAKLKSEINVHDGIFRLGTFIISNHADELTCWTPILSVLSCPEEPLPFLAIPCCSHSLDGSRRRYTAKDITSLQSRSSSIVNTGANGVVPEDQPASGDLKAMRTAKQEGIADDKSTYACLTRKTASLAQELGCHTELTLMRIPSTRNIGIVGNRKRTLSADMSGLSISDGDTKTTSTLEEVKALVERECSGLGGIEASAHTWIERARKLQGGQGRGKVNLNSHVPSHQD